LSREQKQTDKALRIRKLLLHKQIKQTQLATRFKVSKSLISQAISGKHDPMPELQNKIYEYLKSL
jgi:transcriptional regulator with XRE-family HTH domain